MSDETVNTDALEPLCNDCDATFSEFLNEMAEQNAKVATCPQCGKIHDFSKPKPGDEAAHDHVKKAS